MRSYSLEEILSDSFMGPGDGLDEDDAVVGLGFLGVEALDAEGHFVVRGGSRWCCCLQEKVRVRAIYNEMLSRLCKSMYSSLMKKVDG